MSVLHIYILILNKAEESNSFIIQTGNGSNKAEGSYMSLFCLCVIDNFDKEDLLTYTNQIEMYAKE